jgi:regulator of protease activity HflC (stomatin/prohibitin superfamily)
MENQQEVAPDAEHKGLQLAVLKEGRYFRNPYFWDWSVYPMIEIPEDKMGIRVRLYGDDLPYGHFVATNANEKGIVKDVLKPGRYAINAVVRGQERNRRLSDYVEIVELHDPVTIPAGFKGVVTNLAGPIPENPNTLLVEDGFRGVQQATLEPGSYYMNPYMYRISAIDCRSQRFNLAENKDMGFPSKDGFWVSLDGIIEFRVNPDKAAEVFVTYNDVGNDVDDVTSIDQEIIQKIIMPNARSFCRLRGSNSSGRDFIGGETRTAFQSAFQQAIRDTCEQQGIEIVQALITQIYPPQAIAKPVRDREVARQTLRQFQQEKLQQDAEALLAVENALIKQKTALIEADREVVKKVVKANELQQVAVLKANEELEVAKRDLEAAQDKSEAILARKGAEAGVIEFENQANAAGWKRTVEAFSGDGEAFAQYVMYQKLAPGFRSIMTNTADSPLMEVFRTFAQPSGKAANTPHRPLPLAGKPNQPNHTSKPADTGADEAAAEPSTADTGADEAAAEPPSTADTGAEETAAEPPSTADTGAEEAAAEPPTSSF